MCGGRGWPTAIASSSSSAAERPTSGVRERSRGIGRAATPRLVVGSVFGAARPREAPTHRARMESSRVPSAIRKAVRLQMSHPTVVADARYDRRPRVFMLATLVVLFMAAMAAKASATVEVQNYNDPAGDPTTFVYQLFG